jgi:hypothetical protein
LVPAHPHALACTHERHDARREALSAPHLQQSGELSKAELQKIMKDKDAYVHGLRQEVSKLNVLAQHATMDQCINIIADNLEEASSRIRFDADVVASNYEDTSPGDPDAPLPWPAARQK